MSLYTNNGNIERYPPFGEYGSVIAFSKALREMTLHLFCLKRRVEHRHDHSKSEIKNLRIAYGEHVYDQALQIRKMRDRRKGIQK